jgi:hypothetical protein
MVDEYFDKIYHFSLSKISDFRIVTSHPPSRLHLGSRKFLRTKQHGLE